MKRIPRVLIYDFDGVICDSVEIKTEAFQELFKHNGIEIQSQIKKYHLSNGGVSRFEKIRHIEKIFLGNKISPVDLAIKANQFSEMVKEKVINSNYILGALEFISKKGKQGKQYICTGTPENEMIEILEERGIKILFDGIFGSPKPKSEILNHLVIKNHFNRADCLFFGDALTDLEASLKCQIPFCGILNKNTHFPKEVFTIKNFADKRLGKLF